MSDVHPELAHLSIFGALRPEGLERVSGLLVSQCHPQNTRIIEEAGEADGLYVIVEGQVEVRMKIDGTERVIAILGEGAVFGEMAIIDIMKRSASVVATSAVQTLFLSRAAFFSLCTDAPSTFAMVALNLARELSRRLRCADVLLAGAGLVHMDDTYLRARRKRHANEAALEAGDPPPCADAADADA